MWNSEWGMRNYVSRILAQSISCLDRHPRLRPLFDPDCHRLFFGTGINWVLAKTKLGFTKARGFSRQVNAKTEALSERVAAPVIAAHSKATRAQRVGESFFENIKN